jgi:hypothetical protein
MPCSGTALAKRLCCSNQLTGHTAGPETKHTAFLQAPLAHCCSCSAHARTYVDVVVVHEAVVELDYVGVVQASKHLHLSQRCCFYLACRTKGIMSKGERAMLG